MKLFGALILLIIFPVTGFAQSNETTCVNYQAKWEFSAEYMAATSYFNQINTVNLNALYWKKYFKHANLNAQIGITVTYGKGYVTKLKKNSNPVKVYKDNCSATGAGPVIQFRFIILKINRFKIDGQANGAIILYNRKFPDGGLLYNFMFRPGVNIGYDIKNNTSVELGYRWIHVSNGTGINAGNPYYEGQGINLSITRYIF